MKKSHLIGLLSLCFCKLSWAQLASYAHVGQWPYGPPSVIELFETGTTDLLFYNEGTVLHIGSLDQSGQIQPLSSFRTVFKVKNIAVSPDGQLVAVSDESQWISLLNLANPSSPILMGRFDLHDDNLPVELAGGVPEGLDFLDNETLIAAVTPKGIWAIDVSDPTEPALLGDYFEPGIDTVFNLKIVDGHAFTTSSNHGVSVFDLSDLNDINLVLRDATLVGAKDIQVVDGLAYVARGGHGVSVLAIGTVPVPSLTELLTVDPGVSALKVMPLADDHLAIADEWYGQGVLVVDISDPANPALVDNSGTSSPGLVVKDDHIIALDAGSPNGTHKNGLVVYDTDASNNPPALQEISFAQLHEATTDASVSGDKVTLTLRDGGTVVVDISNPNRPDTALWMYPDKVIRAAVTVGDFLVSADEYQNLFIDDISDINNPQAVPTHDIGFRFPTHMIPVDNDHVLIAYGDEIDWLNIGPTGATQLSHYVGTSLSRLALEDHLVVATGSSQFTIIDYSLVGSPLHLAQHQTTDIIQDVALANDHVYLALGTGGVQIVDIQNPVNVAVVGQINLFPFAVTGVAVHNQVLYVAGGLAYGLLAYDVTDPTSPQPLPGINTPDDAIKVAVNDDLLVIADTQSGAIVFSGAVTDLIFASDFEQPD